MNLELFNTEVANWADQILQQLKTSASKYRIQHRADSPSPGSSVTKMSQRAHYDQGMINRIGIRLPRTLIYPDKGAGKGFGGTNGSSWLDQYGQKKTTNPASLGKMGTGSRIAKPFFQDAMSGPDGIEKLGDIAARSLADVYANNILIK
jgi:hypothetical protein